MAKGTRGETIKGKVKGMSDKDFAEEVVASYYKKPRKKAKKKPKNRKKELDKIAIDLWKEKAISVWGNRCNVCLAIAQQIHHYIPRSKSSLLKHDVQNAVPICRKCHFLIHNSHNPDKINEIYERIRATRGESWCIYIDTLKQSKDTSYYTIGFLETQIEILRGK